MSDESQESTDNQAKQVSERHLHFGVAVSTAVALSALTAMIAQGVKDDPVRQAVLFSVAAFLAVQVPMILYYSRKIYRYRITDKVGFSAEKVGFSAEIETGLEPQKYFFLESFSIGIDDIYTVFNLKVKLLKIETRQIVGDPYGRSATTARIEIDGSPALNLVNGRQVDGDFREFVLPEATSDTSARMLYYADFSSEELRFFGLYVTEIHGTKQTASFRVCELDRIRYLKMLPRR